MRTRGKGGINMKENDEMGRFSVEFAIANLRDVVGLPPAERILGNIKHTFLSGVVDSSAAKLILPQFIVDQLGLPKDGEVMVRYADHRQAKRTKVSDVWIELNGRNGVFSAIVEPARKDALIGAIVLEELDLLVDCEIQALYPRDPNTIITEIE